MRDSDEIRRRIDARLNELGLDAVQVSHELGFNRGYLYDYLRKGTPRTMPQQTKLKLAQRLQMAPADLGIEGVMVMAHPPGLAEDVEAYHMESGGDFPPHIALFKVGTRALDRHPRNIVPGRLAAIDLNRSDPARISVGSVVIAQLCDRRDLTKSHGTVLRQFVPPDKLVTNSSESNDIMALDDQTRPYIAVIKGTLAYLVDALEHDSDALAPPN